MKYIHPFLQIILTLGIVAFVWGCTFNISMVADTEKPNNSNQDCNIYSIRLKAQMPSLPVPNPNAHTDKEIGDLLIKHIEELRAYIKTKDDELLRMSAYCK